MRMSVGTNSMPSRNDRSSVSSSSGPGQTGGVGGVVLHDDRERFSALGQPVQQRLDQRAGRAFALGDDDQSVGQGHRRMVAAALPIVRRCS
jgi:hypothetical protein